MKRIIIAAAMALTLTACTAKKPLEETDTLPEELSETLANMTVSEFPEVTAAETSEKGITVFGEEYLPTEDFITIDMNRSGMKSDVNALSMFDDLKHIRIENVGDKSIDFLSGLKLESLAIYGTSKPAAEHIPALEKCTFDNLYYQTPENAQEQFFEDSTALFTAFPLCRVNTEEANSWGAARPSPLAFLCTREIYGEGTLALHITNNDSADSDWVINSLWIEGAEGDELSPDSDGNLTNGRQSIGETVSYNYTLDIDLNVNMTDKGAYYLCFEATPVNSFEGDPAPRIFRSRFFVCSPFDEAMPSERKEYGSYFRHKVPDFLTGDRLAAFEAAYRTYEDYFHMSSDMSEEYAASHTADEFLDDCPGLSREFAYSRALGIYIDENGQLQPTSGDAGGNLMSGGAEFFPIDGDTFMAVTINGHEDDPYRVWYEAVNFHMTQSEEGWVFDMYQPWF